MLFGGQHQAAPQPIVARLSEHEQLLDLGAVGGVGLGGQIELNGADQAAITQGGEQDAPAGGNVGQDGFPIRAGFLDGEGRKEADGRAAEHNVAQERREIREERAGLLLRQRFDGE